MKIICNEQEQNWLIELIAVGCRGCDKDETCTECIKNDPHVEWVITDESEGKQNG